MKFKRAQGLVEIGLLFAFIAIIAVAAFTPIGGKIKDAFVKMSPQKTSELSTQDLNQITKGSYNSQKLQSAITTLDKGNTTAKDAAQNIQEAVAIASIVSSGKAKDLSNDQAETIARNNSVETSGSMASFISAGSDLTDEQNKAIKDAKEVLNNSAITVKNDAPPLITAIQAFDPALATVSTKNIIDAVLLACDKLKQYPSDAKAQKVLEEFKNSLVFE